VSLFLIPNGILSYASEHDHKDYDSYSELRKHETLNKDYKIHYQQRQSDILQLPFTEEKLNRALQK